MERREFLKAGTAGLATVVGALTCSGHAFAQEASVRVAPVDPDALGEAAIAHYMQGGRTCAESVLLAGCEALGVESEVAPEIALGLAGGIGLQGKTCGAVTGAAMVLGVALAPREPDPGKRTLLVCQAVGAVCKEFEKEFGSTECRRLCGLDLTTPEGRKTLKEKVKPEKCRHFVQSGARLMGEQINKA
jgi:C_GCAxxG_C_C family probable redox protein